MIRRVPTWETTLTFLVGFLTGTFTGAAGKYFADRFTDQRRNQEARRAASRRLAEVAALMPDLLTAIRADVVNHPTVRLCVLLPTPGVAYNSGGQSFFAYAETEHQNLRGKFDILVNRGYVREHPGSNVPRFMLTEEFIAALRAMSSA
jgi:hypothetical protein